MSSGSGLRDLFGDEETKVSCPACKGSRHTTCPTCGGLGAVEIKLVAPSQYRQVMCHSCECRGVTGPCRFCHGVGMVTASRASGFRRAAVQQPSR